MRTVFGEVPGTSDKWGLVASKGDQGVIGPTPSLSIGTVTTGTAAATLSGTDEEPVLSLVLPSAGANGVNTAAIQDGAVTPEKLAVQVGNLLSDNQASGGDTLGDTTGFGVWGGATFERSTAAAASGTGCIEVIYDGTGPGDICTARTTASDMVPVTAGDTIAATVQVMQGTGSRARGALRGAFFDELLSPVAYTSVVQTALADSFKPITVSSLEVPEGATRFCLIVGTPDAGSANDSMFFDEFAVWRVSTRTWQMPGHPISQQTATTANGTNLLDPGQIVAGQEVYGDGTFLDQAQSAISGHVPIPPGARSVTVSGLTAYAAGLDRYVAFHTAAGVLVGAVTFIPRGDTSATLAVPAGAASVAFSIYQRKTSAEVVDLEAVQVEVGSTASTFEAFTPALSTVASVPLPSVRPVTAGMAMLCIGDSITETATVSDDGATYTEGTRDNWPARVAARLGLRLWNYAKSGGNVCDDPGLLARQQASVQITTAIANDRPADIIVYSMGANTIPALGDYATAMGKTTLGSLDRTKAYEALRWAFWTLRDAYPDAVCFAGLPIQRADRDVVDDPVREAIIKMAGRYGFTVVDGAQDSGIVRELETWGSAGVDLYDGLHTGNGGIAKLSHLYSARILAAFEG